MPKRGHSEERIVTVLRQAEAGEKVSEIGRRVGISEATYYAWTRRCKTRSRSWRTFVSITIANVRCVLLEGTRSKTGVGMALARLVNDPEGAIAGLKSQFTNHSMKTLLRTHIERDLQRLDQHVQAFT
jgi:Transposase